MTPNDIILKSFNQEVIDPSKFWNSNLGCCNICNMYFVETFKMGLTCCKQVFMFQLNVVDFSNSINECWLFISNDVKNVGFLLI